MKTGKWMALWIVVALTVSGTGWAGDHTPPGPPGSTMKSLQQIWDKLDNHPTSWSIKIEPICQPGTKCFNPRFEILADFNNEAVLDKETGLVWARDADLGGQKNWKNAIPWCYTLAIGGRKGWRLPTVEELASLVDPSRSSPSLPLGHPFQNVYSSNYWSSTPDVDWSEVAWLVSMSNAHVSSGYKTDTYHVWPVRASQ